MSWGYSPRAVFFDPELLDGITSASLGLILEAEHEGREKLIDVVLTA